MTGLGPASIENSEGTSRHSYGIALRVVVATTSLGCLGASLLGWVVSGAKTRDSYETFRSAQRLGLDDLTPYRVLWFLVPVFTVALVVALVANWVRLAGGLLLVQSLVVGVGGLVVWLSSVPTASGPWVAAIMGGIGLMVAALALMSRPAD